jgi:hypothetical protein
MKYLITESQLNDLIPPSMKRRYAHIHTLTDTLFSDDAIKQTMTHQAKTMSFDEFMKFVLRFVQSWLIMDITSNDLKVIKNSIRIIIYDRIREFWEEANDIK